MNPEQVPLKDLAVYGFWSHKPNRYPQDRQWFACFSNWYPSTFKMRLKEGEGDEITFNCVEQLIMYSKAVLFKDYDTAKKILATSDPAVQKKLGRGVKGYVDSEWVAVRYNTVLRGVRAKCEQNSDIMANLVRTEAKIIAEASPYDRIYGIGLSPTDPDTQIESKWKGKNLLGKILMDVRREKLLAQSSSSLSNNPSDL